MANNVFKPRGATSASKPDAGGAVLRSVPVFGVVKDNIDPIRSGRLRVYIADFGGQDPNDADSWITVNYMTPFYGLTQGDAPKEGYGTYLQNQSAYGMWYSPPDIDSTVICVFINGDPEYGYWIGCVPEPEALYTVPALGAAETVVVNENEGSSYGGATKLPVANINKNNESINENPEFYNQPKPVHSYLAGVLNQQGLIRDTIRGTIGSSAQRETPSRVGWGVNTPGRPIYEGGFTDENIAQAAAGGQEQAAKLRIVSRRAGHSFVMDDGDLLGRDQLIRLRTSLGHQILMSDDGQCLHIIHANGQSWIELGKEGTIDMYATNSVNIRTQGDLNLHADNNINMHAKKDLNIYAENITTNSDKKTNVRVGSDYSTFVQGKTTMKTTGAMSFASAGEASVASARTTYINGQKVNLNTGETSTIPEEVQPIPVNAHTDTLYDSQKGWAAAPGLLLSIASRAPAHAPWANANQGVDVKINNDADANFPSNPNPALQASNNNSTAPDTPVNPNIASTVPSTSAVSAALDKNATSAMVAQTATIAQSIPKVADAIKGGAGIVQQTVNGVVSKTAAVGAMAQTPQQMETAGIIKAGSAALVNNLVQTGKTVPQALTPNLFTGKPGAETLTNYLNNPTAQVKAQVNNFQNAQTQLTNAGVITGKESAGQIAGIVTAGATVGVAATVNAVKASAGTLGQGISGPVNSLSGAANNLLGPAKSLINAGNFAGNMASTITGGLSSLASSLNGLAKNLTGGAESLLNSAKGIAGSAFAAIKNSFPKLKAGVPQDLKQITKDAYAKAQNSGTELEASVQQTTSAFNTSGASAASIASGAASSLVNSAAGSVASGAAGIASGAQGLVQGATSLATSTVTSGVAGVRSAAAAATTVSQTLANGANSLLPSSVATGLGALPGAQKAVSSVVNNAKGAVNNIPGTKDISSAINQITSAIGSGGAIGGIAAGLISKLKVPGASLQSVASAGLPAGAAAALNSAISSLSSGGSVPIKLPTVSVNTVDRGAITTQLGAVFGSSKIPVPNYSGNPATTGETEGTAAQTRIVERAKKIKELDEVIDGALDEAKKLRAEFNKLFEKFEELKFNLPAGDPAIEAALDAAKAKKKEFDEARLKGLKALNAKLEILNSPA